MRPLPEGVYFVNRSEVQVPAGLTEVEQAACSPNDDIDIERVDDDLEVSKDLSIDDFCVLSKERLVIVPGVVTTRIRPRRDGFPRQVFDPKDIACLSSPTACLNDVCINGCAALLYSELKLATVDCAILSTYDLPRIRCNAADERIWRNISWTFYWEKNVWIVPIHRPSDSHWVVCIIYFQTKELHLFDSLADQEPWENDVKDIMKLIERFLTIARQRHSGVQIDLEGWQSRALNVNPCQSNDYDCGLWVLAVMIAVLRGRHVTGLHEAQMSDFRHYLCNLVLSIPART
ncbi:cysteine proteinase [Suillus decipiens]|nr:cysteine proteinase [Suillus decipiens]